LMKRFFFPKLHVLILKTSTITEIWNLPMIPNFELKTPCTTFPRVFFCQFGSFLPLSFRPISSFLANQIFLSFKSHNILFLTWLIRQSDKS
jgi:hypothetical protein